MKNDQPRPRPTLLQKAGRGLYWIASALILPTNHTKLAAFFGFIGLHAATTFLFPRAEDVLKKEGLDPAIAEELAPGKRIHVRQENLAGTLHAINDGKSILALWHAYNFVFNQNVGAYAVPAFQLAGFDIPGTPCTIYMKKPEDYNTALKDVLRSVTGKDVPFHLSVTTAQEYKFRLIHELRHCGEENRKLDKGNMKEADANFAAFDMIGRTFNNRGLARDIIALHYAFSFSETHDSALYIDAKSNGRPIPSQEEINAANAEARAAGRLARYPALAQAFGKSCGDVSFLLEDLCQEAAAEAAKVTTPLGKRRLELYRQGSLTVWKRGLKTLPAKDMLS